MYVTHQPKADPNKRTIPAHLNVALGHQPHRSGTGVHRDKRLARQHTRQGQKQQALRDWN